MRFYLHLTIDALSQHWLVYSVFWLNYGDNRLVSSAKWWTLQDFFAWLRSFIYNRNRRGPRTDPWGTPQFIAARPDSNEADLQKHKQGIAKRAQPSVLCIVVVS